ncbi:MAG: Glyoxalase/bleomycin resistance protein/dioxygenase [Proteobacteria bacterium]|nr:Glyoxalase/bleomycin resistance protein/dioxygenase [Pseudomonadota bacterium]
MHIEHVALWARDIEQLKNFYVKYFDAQAGVRYENPAKRFQSCFLSFANGARLELMQRPDIFDRPPAFPPQQFIGYAHLAIATGSEAQVDALTARLVADGITRLDGPRRTGDGYYESVVLDPEGNRIEITV